MTLEDATLNYFRAIQAEAATAGLTSILFSVTVDAWGLSDEQGKLRIFQDHVRQALQQADQTTRASSHDPVRTPNHRG